MMTSKTLYISEPNKWIRYYKNQVKGKFNPYWYSSGTNQTGGNLGNHHAKWNSYIIPIDNNAREEVETIKPEVTMTSPVEQIVKQAAAEIKRESKQGRKRKAASGKSRNSKVLRKVDSLD
jgi:hypothetical protein